VNRYGPAQNYQLGTSTVKVDVDSSNMLKVQDFRMTSDNH